MSINESDNEKERPPQDSPIPAGWPSHAAGFALVLRMTKELHGDPSYRQMNLKAGKSIASLSRADKGSRLPSWEMTKAYLNACAPGFDEARWKARWAWTRTALDHCAPGAITEATTRPALFEVMKQTLHQHQLAADRIVELLAATTFPESRVGSPPPAEEAVRAALNGTAIPDRRLLGWFAIACGGDERTVELWQRQYDALPEAALPVVLDPPAGARPRRLLRTAAVLGIFATIILGLAADTPLRLHRERRTSVAPEAAQSAPPNALRAIRDRMAALDDPGPTGTYAYTHLEVWSAAEGAQRGPTVRDEQLWWRPDRSGVRLASEIGADGHRHSEPVERYDPGELEVGFAPSADVETLRRRLLEQQPELGATGVLRALGDLASSWPLRPAERSAILEVLATTPGLQDLGMQSDRADPPGRQGRPGLAIAADLVVRGQVVRDTLLIDRNDGRLLSLDQRVITTEPTMELSYLQFVDSGWRDDIPR
jgi:hypothetical protein